MAKQYVMTDYEGCDFVTAGKVYELLEHTMWSQGIIDDEGEEICVRRPGNTCAHLDRIGVWYYVDAEGNLV
jgi:hypothetical protein